MELGLVTFADLAPGQAPQERMRNLLEEARLADELGLTVFAVGEHHRPDYLVSSPATVLAAIAAQTQQIRLSSAVLEVMNRIGRERGWPPSGRREYDALNAPDCPLTIGSPEQVAAKIVSFHELFRPQRYLAHLSIGAVEHTAVMRAIELFGTKVAPLVHEATS